MFYRARLATMSTLLLFASSCKTTENGSSQVASAANQNTSDTVNPNSVVFPDTSRKLVVLDQTQKQRLVDALKQVQHDFYKSADGYNQTPGGNPPPEQEITTCLTVVPSRWSDVTAHYYCTFPSYSGAFFPNIRECFTYLVMPSIGSTVGGKHPNYEETYKYCVYMPVNQDTAGNFKNFGPGAFPAYDATNESQGKAVGPLGWVRRNQEDVFKFLMWGTPCTIDLATQQEILNTYYGVDLKGKNNYTASDTDQVAECKKKRPLVQANGAHVGDLSDPTDGTHCSYDMRLLHPGAFEDCKNVTAN